MASKTHEPCTFCGHTLGQHRRRSDDPRDEYTCTECGCVIEFEPVGGR